MPATPATSLPPGVSPPLTIDTTDNHGGLIVIWTSLALVVILSSMAARIYSACQRHIFQRDDLLFAIMVIVAIAQTGVVLSQVRLGWGVHGETHSSRDDSMLKTAYVGDLLAILALGLSKVTSCIFYETLFSQLQLHLIRGVLVAMLLWTVLSIVLVGVRCSDQPWLDLSASQCGSLFPRWIAITVFDIVTELLLFAYAGFAIHRIQISLRKKLIIGITLESRIMLIPLAAIRLYYMHQQIVSTDPVLLGAYSTVTTEVYIAISVVCLIAAFLKSFIVVFVDKKTLSYSDGTSTSRSKSKRFSSGTAGPAAKPMGHHSSACAVRGWEREDDPMIDRPADARGLQIFKTVQLDVRDESIELADAGQGRASTPSPQY
ncbi:hypothetical protein N7539_007968 [Penicillium diatomitis]|uniref:Rhodopsin domain-containing protein n=1 Tax=Penicillium diatomitis TaxID=2819901 RepID=A0A9W9WUP0_9EURO|nr:uncharacterized protein N7539_007968 [Penicillium diatomitis]KAJ5475681.1 hypothetical protein N7539_007968 [Penicillium diatomitis]